MKVMAGLVEPDTGDLTVPPGKSVGYMEQDPRFDGFATLGDFAASGLETSEAYRVEMVAEGLKLKLEADPEQASGGERRRAALAKLLAEAPDLMLLDEPTNHLDIEAIGWLETQLSETRAAFVLISHDRAFLTTLTRATLWIDRGQVRRQDAGFSDFEAWRDKTWSEEDEARHKLDRKIKAEARWAVEGISARRKRNQGRVRALQQLRADRAAQTARQGAADLRLESGPASGKLVIDAKGLSKSWGERPIVRDFSLRVQRGDRIALMGPNGVGKTTLLNLLIGKETPDTGSLRLGANLELAVFDQTREQLDPDATLWESLTGDAAMRLPGRSDQVMVRGTPRHVVSYLKDFLFDDRQARAPVRSLSGGEKARLLLARIMARPSNLLVLDEPTNDLDIETLDLLQDVLGEFDGTVLLVSHDRDFVDRIATSTILLDAGARATVYAGGWSDVQRQRGGAEMARQEPRKNAPGKSDTTAEPREKKIQTGLSFTERHRLAELPDRITRVEAEIAKLEDYLSTPDLYSNAPLKFQKATEALSERQSLLAELEADWLLLEEKAEAG